jgi:lysophospholipid acyltransferase (LPLAT)-like uncharacterized protein
VPVLKRWMRRLLLVALLWVLFRTVRVVLINWNVLEQLRRQRQGYLIGLWHNWVFCLLDLMGREHYHTMVSLSKDGEDVMWISARFGNLGVRGSPSAGAAGALRSAMRLLRKGEPVIVTPDGPRGPRYVLKPGIVALARRSGVPIVPMTCSTLRRWEFHSWDRTRLFKPFATLYVFVGDPVWLDPAEADEETQRRRLEALMREQVRRAETFTGADARYPDPVLDSAPSEAPPEEPPGPPDAEEAAAG